MNCTRLDVMSLDEDRCEKFLGVPRICVVGCGIEGNSILNRLAHLGLVGAETIALSTDNLDLTIVDAEKRIMIKDAGFGFRGYQKSGKRFSEADWSILEITLKDSDMVFVTMGNSDGMGIDVAPVVSEISKKNGAIVVGMVSTSANGQRGKIQLADENLEILRKNTDALIEIDHSRLLHFIPRLTLSQAISIADQIIAETIKGIVETLTQPSLINLDFADLRTIMKAGGDLFISVGEADIRDSPEKIVRNALRNPLVDLDYHGATGCLLHITGGKDLTLKHAANISSALARELDPKANIIWGARISPTIKEKVRLTAIAKGVMSA
jgi:cell division protein FtsZ